MTAERLPDQDAVIRNLVAKLEVFERMIHKMDDFKLRSIKWHRMFDGRALDALHMEVVERELQLRRQMLLEEPYTGPSWSILSEAVESYLSKLLVSYEPVVPYIDF